MKGMYPYRASMKAISMTIKEILAEWLIENGWDGFVNTEHPCDCRIMRKKDDERTILNYLLDSCSGNYDCIYFERCVPARRIVYGDPEWEDHPEWNKCDRPQYWTNKPAPTKMEEAI